MTIQPIGAGGAAVYLTSADLAERGIRARELTARHALALAREAFRQAGLPLAETVEVEAWPDKSGLLVFVRQRPPRRTVWSFADGEDLLLAARSAIPEGEGELYWWEGAFLLVLSGLGEGETARLAEFARLEEDPWLADRLAEHGVLLAENAPAALRRYFMT